MGEGNIKSAREIVQEKLSGLGEASQDDKLRWKYVPEGRRLGVRYLDERDVDLSAEMAKFPPEAIKYVNRGIEEVMLEGINLPSGEFARQRVDKAASALKLLKRDKTAVDRIMAKIKYVLDHYATSGSEQKKQIYEGLKNEFRRQLKQSLSEANIKSDIDLDVESLPQFQEELRRAQGRIDSEYSKLLNSYKEELKKIS